MLGGAGRDLISGDAGDDAISGGLGNDRLTGGLGRDNFIFDTALAANIDAISDFTAADDTIKLENSIFTAFQAVAANAVLASAAFRANAGGVALDSDDRIVYNTTTGALVYDVNGSAAGGAVQFATLTTKPALSFLDFTII